jgi:hypothetical protein
MLPLVSFSQTQANSSFKPYAEYEGLFLFEDHRFIGFVKLDTSYYAASKNIKAIGCYVMDTSTTSLILRSENGLNFTLMEK